MQNHAKMDVAYKILMDIKWQQILGMPCLPSANDLFSKGEGVMVKNSRAMAPLLVNIWWHGGERGDGWVYGFKRVAMLLFDNIRFKWINVD